MLKPLLLKFFGALVAVFPLLQFVWMVLTRGWSKVTKVKERPLPPKTLNDPKWGEHR